MRNLIRILVLVGASLGLIACGGGGSSSGGSSGLSGTWRGSTSSLVVAFTSPMSLNINNDDGVNFSGTATVNKSPCFQNSTLAGSRNGATINAGVVNGNNALTATLTLNGNTLSGSYFVQIGACAGDRGTISVSR